MNAPSNTCRHDLAAFFFSACLLALVPATEAHAQFCAGWYLRMVSEHPSNGCCQEDFCQTGKVCARWYRCEDDYEGECADAGTRCQAVPQPWEQQKCSERCPCKPGDVRDCPVDDQMCGTQVCETIGDWGLCQPTDRCNEEEPECPAAVGPNSIDVATGIVTYAPSWADAEIQIGDRAFVLRRGYSTRRASQDAVRERGVPPDSVPRAWTAGWHHDFEHTLMLLSDIPPRYQYRKPGGEADHFFSPDYRGMYHPADRIEFGTWPRLRLADGTLIEFEPVDGTISYRPIRITYHDRSVAELTYYAPGADNPCDANAKLFPGDYDGKLCTVFFRQVGAGPVVAGLHFADYARNSEVVPDCGVADLGLSVLQRLSFGRGVDVTQYAAETVYSHVASPRIDGDGVCIEGVASTRLVAVAQYTGAVVTRQQSYAYTEYSYARPELGGGETNPYAESTPIVLGILHDDAYAMSIPLLQQIRDGAGEVIEGYEYTRAGRGAAIYSPGEYLRIQYDDGASRTAVYNESTGSQVDYIIAAGRVQEISDSCGCSGNGSVFERATASSRVLAETDLLSVRTRYFHDAVGRKAMVLTNWEDALTDPPPSAATLHADPTPLLLGPTRVTTFEYGSSAAMAQATVESRVASAMCPPPSGSSWPVSCPSSWPEPRVERALAGDGVTVEAETRFGLTVVGLGQANPPLVLSEVELETSYLRDSLGQLTSVVDAAGGTLVFEYHGTGPEVAEYDRGQVWKVSWQDAGAPAPTVTLEERAAYNVHGVPEQITRLDGWTEQRTYDLQGRVVKRVVGPPGGRRVTVFGYLANDRLAYVARGPEGAPGELDEAAAVTQKLSYNDGISVPPADPTFCADASQCVADLGLLGKPTTELFGTGLDASWTPAERTATSFLPNGAADVRSQYLGVSDLRHRVGFAYDNAGRLVRRLKYTDDGVDPSAVADFGFDLAGRNTRTADPRFAAPFSGGQPPAYDPALPNANRVVTYDALGRVAAVTVGAGTAAQATTTYAYDVHDNLTKVTDGDGRETGYLYDDFARLVLVDSPDSGLTQYAYDSVGNLVMKLDSAGTLTKYEYDGRYRLRRVFFAFDPQNPASTADIEYFYDSAGLAQQSASCELAPGSGHVRSVVIDQTNVVGRLSWVRHGGGRTYFAYTPFGEIAAIYEHGLDALPASPCELLVSGYSFDGAGRPMGVIYPSGRRLNYQYENGALYPTRLVLETPDGAGGFVSATMVTAMAYNVGGELAGYTVDGQLTFTATWDYAGQAVRRLYDSVSSGDFDWTISTRDPTGNIEVVGDAASAQSLTLTYDGQDRLGSALGTMLRGYQQCSEFEYDLAGNRVADTCFDREVTYVPESGASTLASLEFYPDPSCGTTPLNRSFEPDALGRATTSFSSRFPSPEQNAMLAYDALGRVSSTTPFGQLSTYYAYDHRNLRVAKIGPAASWRYVYDQAGRLLSERFSMPSTLQMEYVYVGATPVAVIVDPDGDASTGAGVYALATDHLGTPMRAIDTATGQTSWAADYEAFGKAWTYVPNSSDAPDFEINLRFPGHYYDAESGLHYNWNRYLDPNTGRFLQPDPLNIGRLASAQNRVLASSQLVTGFYDDLTGEVLITGQALDDYGDATPVDSAYSRMEDPRREHPFAYGAGSPLGVTDPLGLSYVDDGWEEANLGVIVTPGLLGGAVQRCFGKGGLLNSNRWVRIGFGRAPGGRRVFRIGGDILKKLGVKNGKIDLKDLGPL